jgi:hypothetical protein
LGVDKNRGGGPKIDYKEVLDKAQFAVFARLRDLRKRSGESQRDYVMQPKVGPRHESLPWENAHRMIYNTKGVVSGRSAGYPDSTTPTHSCAGQMKN